VFPNRIRLFSAQKLRIVVCISYLVLGLASATPAATVDHAGAPATTPTLEAPAQRVVYEWNLRQEQQPLLRLPAQINNAADLSLTYPLGKLVFPLFQPLKYDARANQYLVQIAGHNGSRGQVVAFKQTDLPGRYVSSEFADLQLVDNEGVKAIRSGEGTEYTFVRFIDGVDRCIRVKTENGSIINLVYAKDNLIHGVVDSLGRAIRFNYQEGEITSLTQTWVTNAVTFSKTWNVAGRRGSEPPSGSLRAQVKLAHASSVQPTAAKFSKPIPNNALTPQYTAPMAGRDRQLAAIFGDPGAVAAANSYEPPALAQQYPLYRGDLIADNGRLIRGHLSYAMHLYGNADGTGDSSLYVPAGFTSHSSEPGPTDAAVTFYYPRLGNLTDVTLAVFHVANFSLRTTGVATVLSALDSSRGSNPENARVRIGNIGGPGGSYSAYKHSHIEFYRGNTGLPSSEARERLRIDPASVFARNSLDTTAVTRTRTTSRRSDD
jgi:hypothetical protein